MKVTRKQRIIDDLIRHSYKDNDGSYFNFDYEKIAANHNIAFSTLRRYLREEGYRTRMKWHNDFSDGYTSIDFNIDYKVFYFSKKVRENLEEIQDESYTLIDFLWENEESCRTNISVMKQIAKKVTGYNIIGDTDDRRGWHYAFVRLYDEAAYIGTIPYWIGFIAKGDGEKNIFSTDYLYNKKKYELRKNADYITREPEKSWLSNNGGDYYQGYSLYELPDGKFQTVFNSCLYSDFSNQTKLTGEIFNTKKEAVHFITSKVNILYVNVVDKE